MILLNLFVNIVQSDADMIMYHPQIACTMPHLVMHQCMVSIVTIHAAYINYLT